MGDVFKSLRLAAVQANPVFLDRERTVEKACRLIREAGQNGADVVGFPESFVPSHPGWLDYLNGVGETALGFGRELFKNAVEIPSPATDALGEACRDARCIAVIGMTEKRPRTTGTMWNTQLFIDRTGDILGKHQKLVPTIGERLVHTGGDGGTLQTVDTHFGGLSALVCGENSNPLAVFAMAAGYPLVHVASWPQHFSPTSDMADSAVLVARSLAYQLKAFVISACGVVTDELIECYGAVGEDRERLRGQKSVSASCITGPRGQVVAGPLPPGEGILYCDVNTEDVIVPKLILDYAGHYNRPDVFSVQISDQSGRVTTIGRRRGARDEEPTVTGATRLTNVISAPTRDGS